MESKNFNRQRSQKNGGRGSGGSGETKTINTTDKQTTNYKFYPACNGQTPDGDI